MAILDEEVIKRNPDYTKSAVVRLQVWVGDIESDIEIQRAPEDSGDPGNPDTAAAVTIYQGENPGGPFTFIDLGLTSGSFSNAGEKYYYQARHTLPGKSNSDWFPTDWVEATAAVPYTNPPPLPSYPITFIQVEEIADQPQNMRVKLNSSPQHPDNVFRYTLLDPTDAIPQPSTNTTDWPNTISQVSASFIVSKDESLIRRIAAFSDLNNIYGGVATAQIDMDTTPEIGFLPMFQSGDGADSGSSCQRIALPDGATRSIKIYRRVQPAHQSGSGDLYPTDDDSATGNLPNSRSAWFKGEVPAEIPSYEDGGYATDQVIFDLWVPVNKDGVEGPRMSGSYAVVGSEPVVPSVTLGIGSLHQAGTSCTPADQRQYALNWTVSGVTDGSHDLKIYARVNIGDWILVDTVTTPVTTTSGNYSCGCWPSGGKYDPIITRIEYKVELVETATSTIDDTAERGVGSVSFAGTICEFV